MIRSRVATLGLLGLLGLACGCNCFSNRPMFGGLFHRHRDKATTEVAAPVMEGPILEDVGPPPVPPPTACQPGIPSQPVPTLTPPRLVPQPQSQPLPYVPPQ